MEVGPHGITDYGGKITADLKVGTNIMKPLDGSESIKGRDNSFGPIKDQSISIIGAEAKISLTGGFTTAGHGILRGVK